VYYKRFPDCHLKERIAASTDDLGDEEQNVDVDAFLFTPIMKHGPVAFSRHKR
jgi:hypothetical protein